jgi:hypothetical protein
LYCWGVFVYMNEKYLGEITYVISDKSNPIVLGIDEQTGLAVSLVSAKKFLPLDVLLEIKNVVDLSISYWEKCTDNIDDINNILLEKHIEQYMVMFNKEKSVKKITVSHLYIMTDTKNGFHKIGISKEPKYRESTLQSEKPSILLIWSSPVAIENVNKIEAILHEKFSSKRIRGEWFDLCDDDIYFIKNSFQNLLIVE